MDILPTGLPNQKLQSILQEICDNGSESKENWESLVDSALEVAESLSQTLCMDVNSQHDLEKSVIHLWNKTVVLKVKGNVQKQVYGKLRHICYQVTAFLNESIGDIASLKKQIMMGLKATRAWIDGNEFQYAEKVLNNLQETMQRLQHSFVEMKNVAPTMDVQEEEKRDIAKDTFSILCLKAEVSFSLKQNSESIAAVKKAKEMLSNFPSEAFNLSMLCYNFGVDSYQSKVFKMAIAWLRESCDINKDVVEPNPKTEARTLRLMANCYLEGKCENWREDALNAVTLANQKYCHIAGLYVRLQLFLESEEPQSLLQHAIKDITDHKDFDIDLCINLIRLLKKFQRPEIAFEVRQNILMKFERHPEPGCLWVTLLDLLLNSQDATLAQVFAEECITAHNTGQKLEELAVKQFHSLFWMKAAQYFEQRMFDKAATWYNYSLSLFPSMSVTEPNLAKLQRNLANCYLNLGELSKAAAAIEIAERCDKKDAHTRYIIFKTALELEDAERALTSLKDLVECFSHSSDKKDLDIICLVANTALERNRTELATIALEYLILNSDVDKQILTALKCMLRLLVIEIDKDENFDKKVLLCHIRTAYNKILSAKERCRLASAEVEEEAAWFMKMAWNMALQSKEDPFCMKEFFTLCFELLSLCPQSPANFNRHQNCLLMSCAACLQLARQPQNQSDLQNLLVEVLHHIEEYKQAHMKAQESLWSQGCVEMPASTEMFLLLYEFEALAKLRDPKAEAVVERALTMPNPTPKLFHTLSVLAMDAPANNRRVSVRALKVAIRLHLQSEEPDFVKCSADVRNLINISLVFNDKEALVYFKETMDMVEKRAKDKYPPTELLWLMTKAWNWGLQYYNCERLVDAEQWCSLSMSFLKHLPLAREDYQEQMMSVYGEILNRLEQSSKEKGAEE